MIKRYYWIVLISIILFHTANNIMILKLDTTLPTCHPGDYYTNSRSLYFTLLNNPIMFIPELLKIDPVYPPLLYVSPFYFYCFGGYGYDTAILAISILYLSLLVIFLYLIGAHLFNREVGLLSVILCSFFPGIFGYSRMFLMALPSVALSMINVYVMIRSDCFRIKKYSLLFGLFLGLGMLMVKYYAVLLLGLSLGYLFDHMNIITHEKKRICFNLLLTFGIAIVIALPWYAVSMRYIFAQCQEAKHVVFFGRKAVFDFFSYSKHLIDYQIGIFFFSIFIISFGYLLVKRKLSRMMILWIMWPYVICSLVCIDKSPRYTMLMIPAIALIVSIGIVDIFRKFKFKAARAIKSVSIFAIIIYVIYNYFNLSYGHEKKQLTLFDDGHRFFNTGLIYPQRIDWDLEEIEALFLTDKVRDQNLLDVFGCCYLLNEYIQSMIVFKRLPIFYPNLDLELNSDNSKAYFEDWIQKAHFVLMRSDNGSDFPNISQCLIGESVDKIDVCIKLFKKKYISQFELVKKIFISDEHEKTALLIYKKINGSQAHLN